MGLADMSSLNYLFVIFSSCIVLVSPGWIYGFTTATTARALRWCFFLYLLCTSIFF